MKELLKNLCLIPPMLLIPEVLLSCSGDKKGKETAESEEEGETTDTPDDSSAPINKSSCNGDFWVQVTTGTYLTCGLDNEGCTDCWGNESLGGDTGTYAWEPTGDDMPPDETFVQISLPPTLPEGGGWNGCGLTVDQRAVCWGEVEEPPVGDFSFVGAGKYSGCALDLHGMVSCWGHDEELVGLVSGPFLQLSIGETDVCGILPDKTLSCGREGVYAEHIVPPEGRYIDVDASYTLSACALSEDGEIVCWGYFKDSKHFVDDLSIIDIEVGGFDLCMLNVEGQITCLEGKYMPPDKIYTQMDLGAGHGCAVDVDGNIECWGGVESTGVKDVPLLHE